MRNIVIMLILAFLLFTNANCASQISLERGREWLSRETSPPEVNVDGDWYSSEWGRITLRQCKGCREVTGTQYEDGKYEGWKIEGVVSGKSVFLVMHYKGNTDFTATLTAQSDRELTGVYVYGLMTNKSQTKNTMLLHR